MKYKKITECTLLLITHERPELASKSLNYYKNFFSKIKILDSSKIQNKYLANKYEYYHCKNLNIVQKVFFGLSKTKTKYTIITPDDDFFFPDSVKKGISFLKKNQEFVSVGGKYYSFEKIGFIKKFNLMYKKNYNNISENLAQKRLKKICSSPMMQMTYNLMNTKLLIKSLSNFKFFQQANFLEDTITLTNILFGKHKNLNLNWMIRDGSVNTVYFESNNSIGLFNLKKKKNNIIFKKFLNMYFKLLKSNNFKFDKKETEKNLKKYFSRSEIKSKSIINDIVFANFFKTVYKLIWFSIFNYRYWLFFSQKEKNLINLIFKL